MTDESPPPYDEARTLKLIQGGIACDHHFGDDGTSAVCTKCGMDRDTAERVGRAHSRRRQQQKRMRGE